MFGRNQAIVVAMIALGALAATGRATIGQTVPDYAAIVAAPDRSEADRETDKRRDPVQLLAFTGVKPGMKVLDLGAAAGYSTELLARVVGPSGVVYATDSPAVVERVKDRFAARAAAPAMQNVSRLVRSYDDPLPAEIGDLDLITFFFFYHDTTYMDVDRDKMNRALYAALKPGGLLVIADHSARPGDGATVGKTFHRIEESTLRKEVEAAGFVFVEEGGFLRHPEDPRDVAIFKPKVPVDEFILKFRKPG